MWKVAAVVLVASIHATTVPAMGSRPPRHAVVQGQVEEPCTLRLCRRHGTTR